MAKKEKVTLDDLNETPQETTETVEAAENESVETEPSTPTEETAGGKRVVSASEIMPNSNKETEKVKTFEEQCMDELADAVERVKGDIDELKEEYNEKVEMGEIAFDPETGEPYKPENPVPLSDAEFDNVSDDPLSNVGKEPKKKIKIADSSNTVEDSIDEDEEDYDIENTPDDTNKVSPVSFEDMNDDDFFDDLDKEFGTAEEDTTDEEEDKELTEEEQNAQIEKLKTAITEKVTPIKAAVDLSKFTIRKKPIAISKLINMTEEEANVTDWILWSAKRPFSMREFKGAEIDKLNVTDTSRNRLNKLKEVYRLFYDHIVDANKPKDFESWLKSTSFFEINHLWFNAYKASFSGANSIPYSCPKCKEMFIVDTPFDDMVKYENDDVKKEVERILQMDTTTPLDDAEYEVELKQVSDEYVFALKEPTLWGVIFETAALSDDFTTKYQDVLGLLAYIDDIYYIDRDTSELIPVNTNPDPNNATKTAMRKISAYYKILSTLNSDQYYNLTNFIQKINERDDMIKFQLPECTCPKCKAKIPAEERTPEQLLFTRHQLRAIANISTK